MRNYFYNIVNSSLGLTITIILFIVIFWLISKVKRKGIYYWLVVVLGLTGIALVSRAKSWQIETSYRENFYGIVCIGILVSMALWRKDMHINYKPGDEEIEMYPLGTVVKLKDEVCQPDGPTVWLIVGQLYGVVVPWRGTRSRTKYYPYCAIPCSEYYRNGEEKLEVDQEKFEKNKIPLKNEWIENVVYRGREVELMTDERQIVKKRPLREFDETHEYLPQGTVVKIFDSDTLFMVVERKMEKSGQKYDYRAVSCPKGYRGLDTNILGGGIFLRMLYGNPFQYFNHKDIEKIIRKGYTKNT